MTTKVKSVKKTTTTAAAKLKATKKVKATKKAKKAVKKTVKKVKKAKKLTQRQQIAKVNAKLSKAQRSAKLWIAYHESRYSYTARNGRCYGRYQLLTAYLHGNYSPLNQEKVANKYVAGRYGSWTNAKRFWLSHNWY
ncbi:aggregation-promoting factor C-terminal-like domain-containing protein [Lactiplantibacillus carotarum]|uniref:aggregation-promoting factor C-terminal-like domain-containing protein n=1 Tax=Lactiplantibacillus carotarum TaxID=2993456 RepID=UPI00298EF424|nr:transglycosylase [Lactiplantibacillus carotarum]